MKNMKCPCAGQDRFAFLRQLRISSSLDSGRLPDSRPVLLSWYPLRLFEFFPVLKNKVALSVSSGLLILCAGQDSNLRRPKSTGLQPVAIDHSATDAFISILVYPRK